MKHIKKQSIPIWLPISLCVTLSFSILLLLFLSLGSRTSKNSEVSEFVYIYLSQDDKASQADVETGEISGWILRAYQDRIGIFREDGSLENILDIQIKTLPKADQLLLEEGIYAKDQNMLDSLIEDYSE